MVKMNCEYAQETPLDIRHLAIVLKVTCAVELQSASVMNKMVTSELFPILGL